MKTSIKSGKSTQFDNEIRILHICSQFTSKNIKGHGIFKIDTVIITTRKSINTVDPEELDAPVAHNLFV